MSEIKRQDLITDDALMAPLILAERYQKLYDQLQKIKEAGKASSAAISNAEATSELGKEVEKLTLQQQELDKIQKQIAVTIAKDTDEYRKQQEILAKLKKDLKDKTTLTVEEAKQVNAQNASLIKLDAALKKNRESYANLRTEQERQSKAGKDLLKVIQEQDKSSKALSASMGQAQKNVGAYGDAFAALDNQIGGAGSQVKNLLNGLKALATNPYFLLIAGAIAIFQTLKSAVEAYYTTTLEGEEAYRKDAVSSDTFFTILKRGWADTGKEAEKQIQEGGGLRKFYKTLTQIAQQYLTLTVGAKESYDEIAKAGDKFAELQNKLFKDHLRDVVDDGETELQVNELLDKSKNKLLFKDRERLEFLKQADVLLKKQLDGDIELAKADVLAAEQNIRRLGGRIESGKLISKMTDEEIKGIGVTGDEIKKLADAQVNLLKIQSDAFVKKKGLDRQESALTLEIEKQERDILNREVDARLARKKQDLQIEIDKNDEIGKDLDKSLQDRSTAIDTAEKLRLKQLALDKQNEINIVRRATEDRIRAEGGPFSKAIVEADKALQEQLRAIDTKYNNLKLQDEKATEDSLLKLRIDAAKKLAEQEYRIAKASLDGEVQIIKQAAIDGKKSKEQADKEILELQKKHSDEYIQIQIDELQKILAIDGLSKAEQEKVTGEIYKLKIDLQNAFFEQLTDKEGDLEKRLQNILNIYQSFARSLNDLFSSFTSNRLQDIDVEEQHNKDRLDRELKAAGDNEAAKAKIQEAFDKKEQELQRKKVEAQRKQAVFDKIISAVQAGIATALAVAKALPNIPLSIAVGAAGAIEVAAILAKNIPAYEFGTDNHPGGLAIVGDGPGFERVEEPGKLPFFTPNMPTVMDLAPGTKVVPHEETMRDIALKGLRAPDKIGDRSDMGIHEVRKEIASMHHTIKNKRELRINFSRKGVQAAFANAQSLTEFLNEFYR